MSYIRCTDYDKLTGECLLSMSPCFYAGNRLRCDGGSTLYGDDDDDYDDDFYPW